MSSAEHDGQMIQQHVTLMTQNKERSIHNAKRLSDVETKQDDVRERLPPVEAAMIALSQLPQRFSAVESDVRANRWIVVTGISLVGVAVVVAQVMLSRGA